MSLSNLTSRKGFAQKIAGLHGTFQTNAGQVDYLLTKAKLASGSEITDEARLTEFLLPVREALETRGMDFNQLLQRDLDDHRVATELVPYLLNPNTAGPAFFPPIVAVMLPFDRATPADDFETSPLFEPKISEDGSYWSRTTRGDAYQIDKLLTDEGSPNPFQIGRLRWNQEKAKLLVVDGQHRAMALLAIHRTLSGGWKQQGEKYRSFYEGTVNAELKKLNAKSKTEIFAAIELPVAIVWFPELKAESKSHQVSARKLFVDVNKNARTPSKSRLMLLSDRHLPSVLMRATLNRFREAGHDNFPIYAVEYDHPDSSDQTVAKWSAITNVAILAAAIKRLLMGPSKHFLMQSKLGGQESPSDLAESLQRSLDVESRLPAYVEEDGVRYRREYITEDWFPPKHIDDFVSAYISGWGSLIEGYLTDLAPYAAHSTALKTLQRDWVAPEPAPILAKDAIFEGVGVFWTLKAGHSAWRDKNTDLRSLRQPELEATDVVSAWQIIERKHTDFKRLRAKYYLGSEAKERESEAAYRMFETAACQVGLMLAARALWRQLSYTAHADIQPFARKFISLLNIGLNSESKDRRLAFVKDPAIVARARLNMLGNLDVPDSVHFRYFWIQILDTSEVASAAQEWAPQIKLLASQGRASYRDRLLKDSDRDLKRMQPQLKPEKRVAKAKELVDNQLLSALKRWFNVEEESYKEWLSTIQKPLGFRDSTGDRADIQGVEDADDYPETVIGVDSSEDDFARRILGD